MLVPFSVAAPASEFNVRLMPNEEKSRLALFCPVGVTNESDWWRRLSRW